MVASGRMVSCGFSPVPGADKGFADLEALLLGVTGRGGSTLGVPLGPVFIRVLLSATAEASNGAGGSITSLALVCLSLDIACTLANKLRRHNK